VAALLGTDCPAVQHPAIVFSAFSDRPASLSLVDRVYVSPAPCCLGAHVRRHQQGRCLRSGLPVALKVYFKQRVAPNVAHMVMREAALQLRACAHRFVLKLYGVFQVRACVRAWAACGCVWLRVVRGFYFYFSFYAPRASVCRKASEAAARHTPTRKLFCDATRAHTMTHSCDSHAAPSVRLGPRRRRSWWCLCASWPPAAA
jgi:hypothetical protein